MPELKETDQAALLQLARATIEARLRDEAAVERPASLSTAVTEQRACFVTLHKGGALRGCIGSLEPSRPLVEEVTENAINAAFRDPRFPPLSADELDAVDLEISVLTRPEPLPYTDGEDLKRKLKPGVHGVILKKGWNSATFLPQVWDQLPDPEAFLAHLCQKARLSADCWRSGDVEVKVYEVRHFSEPPPARTEG
jgi:AmmeMemoRadiSam system protein A